MVATFVLRRWPGLKDGERKQLASMLFELRDEEDTRVREKIMRTVGLTFDTRAAIAFGVACFVQDSPVIAAVGAIALPAALLVIVYQAITAIFALFS
jgi:hypothetical protein